LAGRDQGQLQTLSYAAPVHQWLDQGTSGVCAALCLVATATSRLCCAAQSGKSLVLSELLPSVVREDPVFGLGKTHEMLIFKLDLSGLVPAKVCLQVITKTCCTCPTLPVLQKCLAAIAPGALQSMG
jgi:hypothetical protein